MASSTELTNVHGRAALQHGAAEAQGHTATPSVSWQHAASSQPAAGPRVAPPDANEAEVSSPASLPFEILESAMRGEVQKVVKWLRKGGAIDALCSVTTPDDQAVAVSLLHAAANNGHLELVRGLLKRGASVDLQNSLGYTALIYAADNGELSIVLLLLQHWAKPDLQDTYRLTALIRAASRGHEACVQALLRAGANTELLDKDGRTALQWAEAMRHTAIAALLRQHAAPSQPAAAAPAGLRDAGEAGLSSPASLPVEILMSAVRGELPEVVGWVRKGGAVDAFRAGKTKGGQTATTSLLHAAAGHDRLELVRELLKRGASVDLQNSLGFTALMEAAYHGHASILLVLLQHSAKPDLQDTYGLTALIRAASRGHEACVRALLRAGANTELLDNDSRTALQWAEAKGHAAIAKLLREHAAPSQPVAAAPAAPSDAGEAAVSSPAPLPPDIFRSAARGELLEVVEWLRKGGAIDALGSVPTGGGKTSTTSLLHAAAANGQLEMVRELLKRGASVDLPSRVGGTALMFAAADGHLPILLLLLQHSADPDLQDTTYGRTALMMAAGGGHEACVQALLRAGANTELLDNSGRTALQWAETHGHTASAALLRQHASCRALGLGAALCAALPPTWPWVALSVVLGAIGVVAIRRTLTARPGQHRAARQRQPHRHARHAKAHGRTSTEEPTRQQAAPPQPAAAAAPRAKQAARARAANTIEEPLAKEEAQQARSKKSNKEEGGVGAEAAAAAAAAVGIAAEMAAAEAKAATDKAQAAAEERAAAAERDRAAAQAAAEQAAQEQAAQEQAEEDRLIDEAMARSIASLQADEERRRTTAPAAAAQAAPPPTLSRSPGRANGEPSRAGRGGRGGRGVPRGGRGGRGGGSGMGGDGGAGPSSQAVLSLADAGDITGRAAVPESTIGGETTCIVCMARPKSHIAVPCGHLCVCGVCAERMQDCPYCRGPVQQWMHARVV